MLPHFLSFWYSRGWRSSAASPLLSLRRLHQLNPVAVQVIELLHVLTVSEHVVFILWVIKLLRFRLCEKHCADFWNVLGGKAEVILHVEPINRGRLAFKAQFETVGTASYRHLAAVSFLFKPEGVAIELPGRFLVVDEQPDMVDVGRNPVGRHQLAFAGLGLALWARTERSES